MRICIDYRPALHESTGVGSYVIGLLYGLTRTHPESSYTAFSTSWKHRLQLPSPLRSGVRPIDTRFPVRLLDLLWHRASWPPVESWAGPQELVHSPSPIPVPTRGARRVVTVHDCYFLRHPDQVTGPMRHDYGPLLRSSLHRVDAVMVNTETTRRELLGLSDVDPGKVHVAHLGIDPVFLAAPAPAPPARQDARLPDRYLLFVGRLEPRKDPATLLRGFGRVLADQPNLRLLLVGPDGLGWQETLQHAPPRVRDAIVRLPHQPPQRLAHIYRNALALLLPSRWEGFGLTAVEAMACGTPVIASRAGALTEVLGDAARWIQVGDDEGLAAACLEVLDPQRAAALREAGIRRSQQYRWERTAERTYEVYQRVVNS